LSRSRKLLLLAAFAVVAAAAYVLRVGDDLIDFEVDFVAGTRLLAGEGLYPGTDGHFAYKYLPGAAVLEMPFALLPWTVAKPLFYALIACCLLLSLRLAYGLLPPGPKRRPVLAVWTFVILAKYLLREIDLGQINLILLTLLLLAVSRLLPAGSGSAARRDVTAGVCWAAATTLKPYGLVFLPYLVVTRRFRPLVAGLLAMLALALPPVVFLGPAGTAAAYADWARSLSESTPSLMTHVDNTSLPAFFARLAESGPVAAALTVVAVGGVGLLVLLVVLRGRDLERAVVLDGAILIGLIPLLAPLGWNYMLLMFVPGVMLLLYHLDRFARPWRLLLVADLATIALAISNVIGGRVHQTFEAWSIPTIQFALLVGYLAALRFKRVC